MSHAGTRRSATHLPGLVQPAHGRVAQPHDDGKEGVQVPVLLAAVKHEIRSAPLPSSARRQRSGPHSLGSDLEKLLEKLHPLAELRAQADLCDHPELDFVEPPQEQVQVHRGFFQILPTKRVIDEFELSQPQEEGEENISLTQAGARLNRDAAPALWFKPRAHSERAPSRRRSCGTPHPWSS